MLPEKRNTWKNRHFGNTIISFFITYQRKNFLGEGKILKPRGMANISRLLGFVIFCHYLSILFNGLTALTPFTLQGKKVVGCAFSSQHTAIDTADPSQGWVTGFRTHIRDRSVVLLPLYKPELIIGKSGSRHEQTIFVTWNQKANVMGTQQYAQSYLFSLRFTMSVLAAQQYHQPHLFAQRFAKCLLLLQYPHLL